MSVLHLRRDMVVDEATDDFEAEEVRPEPVERRRPRPDRRPDRAAAEEAPEEPVVEIEAQLPIPLRRYEQPVEIEARIITRHEADEDEDDHRSFIEIVTGWAKIAAVIAVLGAYPAAVAMSSDVGDRNIEGVVDRTQWSAPWAGAAATVMERHFIGLGWASDAPGWAPMARLTAKPAYQSALAGALGEFVTLRAGQEAAAGRSDADLAAAARLTSAASTGVQLRAARDALVSHDRRVRRRDDTPSLQPAELTAQLGLIEGWAAASQSEIAASSSVLGGSPIDEIATQAVYRAKARALAAYVFLDSMQWPEDPAAAAARTRALEAWKAAGSFHPLIVLNGSPDGSIFGNHPASMGFLISQAQKTTADYRAMLPVASVAPAIVADAAPPAADAAAN